MAERNSPRCLRWWLIVSAAVAAIAAFLFLYRFYESRFRDVTGRAKWVWVDRELTSGKPQVAFATRNFDLPADRQFTRLKIGAFPDYTVWFNGTEIGGGSGEQPEAIETFDVSILAREKNNRLVIGVRSADGVGALLASIDVSPSLENYVVSSGRWKLFTRWTDALPSSDPQVPASPVLVIGEPPAGPWNYLPLREAAVRKASPAVRDPAGAQSIAATLPERAKRGGLMIGTERAVSATVWDFGFVAGRVRLERNDVTKLEGVWIALANDVEEWQSPPFRTRIVFAEGERTAALGASHPFRYVIVYENDARPRVVED